MPFIIFRLMAQNEFVYEKEGPESILRAFLNVLQGILVKKGFQETIERVGPDGPDVYVYEKDDQMISLTLTHLGPGTLTITASSGSPVKGILEEALEAFLEGIRVLLAPTV